MLKQEKIAALLIHFNNMDSGKEVYNKALIREAERVLMLGKDKEHWGDCCKVPIACQRCIYDDYMEMAGLVLEES
jgi:hypothetical protein